MDKLNFNQFKLNVTNDYILLNKDECINDLVNYCNDHSIDLGGFLNDYGYQMMNKDEAVNFVLSECDLNDDYIPDLALVDFGRIGNQDDDVIFTLNGYARIEPFKVNTFNNLIMDLQNNYKDYI